MHFYFYPLDSTQTQFDMTFINGFVIIFLYFFNPLFFRSSIHDHIIVTSTLSSFIHRVAISPHLHLTTHEFCSKFLFSSSLLFVVVKTSLFIAFVLYFIFLLLSSHHHLHRIVFLYFSFIVALLYREKLFLIEVIM